MKKKNKKHAVFRYLRKNLTVILLILMTLITVGTFAWFSVTNNPKVQNLALVADHEGNLQIADDVGGSPGTYEDVLDLATATKADYMNAVRLSPVTTKDGVTFFSPNYDSATNTVGSVTQITDQAELVNTYIYEKTFYLKASGGGDAQAIGGAAKYEVGLVGPQTGNGASGSYILKASESVVTDPDTAANVVRISFTVNGQTAIYEPNYEVHNTGDKKAIDGVGGSGGYGGYAVHQQASDGKFVNGDGSGNSQTLFTLDEGVDTLVTMRVWLEGTDVDCTNSVGSDMIKGQIQFISKESSN